MYKILLTDDERIVIDSLTFILEKNFPSQLCIYTAQSGTDALALCQTQKIDIVFMDINMPGLNGLEAVAEIKRSNPGTIVVILSAFDRFQYAQEALALGAYRYLTKPVNRNIITQTVRNAMSRIDAERENLSADIEIRKKLSFVSSIVESDFIYSSIFASAETRNLQGYLEYFKITEDSYYFCCLELPETSAKNKYEAYTHVRDLFQASLQGIVGSFMMNRIAVFIPCNPEDPVRETLRTVYRQLALRLGAAVRLGVSSIKTDIGQTVCAYNEALETLNKTDTAGGIGFADASQTKSEPYLKAELHSEQQLLSRVAAGDVSGVKIYFDRWKALVRTAAIPFDAVKNACFRILVNARNCAAEVRKGYADLPAFANTFSILADCASFSQITAYILPQLLECTFILYESRTAKLNPIIEKVQDFIKDNIGNEISLEQTARLAHVNPFYLSKLFKDETGSKFIDYVTELRLEKGKELLRHGGYSIKEISYRIGYPDQNYFSKLFRRKFGLTPTEYRTSIPNDGGGSE